LNIVFPGWQVNKPVSSFELKGGELHDEVSRLFCTYNNQTLNDRLTRNEIKNKK